MTILQFVCKVQAKREALPCNWTLGFEDDVSLSLSAGDSASALIVPIREMSFGRVDVGNARHLGPRSFETFIGRAVPKPARGIARLGLDHSAYKTIHIFPLTSRVV
jgi:hypothetical protein